jgi:hypothetical protein
VNSSARIFLNYRRADSAGWAGRLHADLAARFGPDRVFRDVGIEPGEDYAERIERVMNECEVCVVLIGHTWTSAATAGGRRRLDDPRDLLRLEIERALSRSDVRVVPVLVDGAPMPTEDELPGGLRSLARLNACQLTDPRWDDDVRRLAAGLRNALGESTTGHERVVTNPLEPAPPPPSASPVSAAVLAMLAATVGAGLVAALLSEPLVSLGDGATERVAGYAVERGVIWTIIGTIVVAAAAAAFGDGRVTFGPAFDGAVAGALGGAAGGAGYMLIKHLGGVGENEAAWLLYVVATGVPGLWLAPALARAVGAPDRAMACAIAVVPCAAAAALLVHDDKQRVLLTVLHALFVVGGSIAVLVAVRQRDLASSVATSPERAAPA